jgi:hypothetical protein
MARVRARALLSVVKVLKLFRNAARSAHNVLVNVVIIVHNAYKARVSYV